MQLVIFTKKVQSPENKSPRLSESVVLLVWLINAYKILFQQNILKYIIAEAKEKKHAALQKGWKMTVNKVCVCENDF